MRQREQGLLAGVEAPPVRAVLVAVGADQVGEVVERAVGQGDRRGVRQQRGCRWGIFLGRSLVLPGASPNPATGTLTRSPTCANPVGEHSLHDASPLVHIEIHGAPLVNGANNATRALYATTQQDARRAG